MGWSAFSSRATIVGVLGVTSACTSAGQPLRPDSALAAGDAAAMTDVGGAEVAQAAADGAAADTKAEVVAEAGSTTTDGAGATADSSACAIKPTLTSLEKEYFAASCAFGSCHSTAKHAGELVLEEGKSYAQLVGVQALHPGAGGFVRVEPGKPDDSFLYLKVTQPQPGQGKLMPVGASEPVDVDCGIAALKAWIAAGAPK